MRITAVIALVAVLSVLPASADAAGKVTLESLLRQMTDLSLLAEFPAPPYVAKQFSSYERASESPKDRDRWFANHDRGFMLYDGAVKEKTPYFKSGPAQGREADGYFPAGTKVGIARNRKPVGGSVWAYTTAADGGPIDGKIPQGYVLKSAITPDPQGHVLAEMDGPGCVTRIWSANPDDAGNLRIYLDGAETPVIDAPMTALLGGKWQTETNGVKWTPFPDPIACERSRGWNLYFPIAYQKHCKITITKPDIYYHVDFRAYPPGTDIETFSLAALARSRKLVDAVAKVLALGPSQLSELSLNVADKMAKATPGYGQERPGASVEKIRNSHTYVVPGGGLGCAMKAEPGGKPVRVKLAAGTDGQSAAVYALRVTVADTKDLTAALRGLVLVGRFDEATRPQVWCPLGDFFGTGPGANPYDSLPLSVENPKDKPGVVQLYSHWRMPFRKEAVFEVQNHGTRPVTVDLSCHTTPLRWTERTLYFHAKWRTQTMKTRPFRDWTYCDLKGKGVFVGDALSVMNPVSPWWGEGDEKIYVDGEKFPSWFGTGTEDYYGYAWCDPKPFQHAYHNQTRCDGPGNRGHTSVNRFHILDAIPFTKSFRFDMEVWHWTPNTNVTYAATSYWYARPGATDDFPEVDAKTLQNIPNPPPPFKVKGAVEGENLKILGTSGNFPVNPQDMMIFPDGEWSGARHLWGRPGKAGEWVDLELPVPADGKYHVVVYLTKARDYGIVQFAVNGEKLGRPIDGFHADSVVSTGPIDLGTAELKKGPATLRVEAVGTNAKSVGLRYMWGLDCVVLKPTGP